MTITEADRKAFWGLLDDIEAKSNFDLRTRIDLLSEVLTALEPGAIQVFEQVFLEALGRA